MITEKSGRRSGDDTSEGLFSFAHNDSFSERAVLEKVCRKRLDMVYCLQQKAVSDV